ncbi:MAG: response regulator [Pyrinomonadaceae bacterium]
MTNDKRPAVLYVEDVSDTRDLVEFSLSQDGFAVTSVRTAGEGIEQARNNKFAVILLDIGLPDKDGLELCREIRTFDQETPVVFYTAFGDLLDMKEASAAGAQACLRKPEDTAQLGMRLRKIVGETE